MLAQEKIPSIPGPGSGEVARLIAFRGDPYLVLSLYMDADARRQELSGVRSRSHSLLHGAREELRQRWDRLEHGVREAALDDLERCRAFLDGFIPRGGCRGLALFSCTGRDWWQDYSLRRSVPDRWMWDADPLVLPTLRIVEAEAEAGRRWSEAAREVGDRQERRREAALLRQLYDAWRSGGGGVVGVPDTLRALYLDEVQILLVDAELRLAGCRCASCGALSEAGEGCSICGLPELDPCPELADEAIGDALARGGQVVVLEEPRELRRDGGMGAVLRFRPQSPHPVTGPETRARTGER